MSNHGGNWVFCISNTAFECMMMNLSQIVNGRYHDTRRLFIPREENVKPRWNVNFCINSRSAWTNYE